MRSRVIAVKTRQTICVVTDEILRLWWRIHLETVAVTAAVYVEEEKNRMRMRGISIEWESVSEKYVCD